VALVVNEAIGRLADLDRDVFLMREVAGLSYDEIAEACDVSVDAVRSRLHRTRLQLREWLAEPIDTERRAPMRQQPVRSRSL
jgi:RNA polymerase sigma-70 factor (ECF subfamily)